MFLQHNKRNTEMKNSIRVALAAVEPVPEGKDPNTWRHFTSSFNILFTQRTISQLTVPAVTFLPNNISINRFLTHIFMSSPLFALYHLN